jgi:hypothetical protein
MQLIFSIEYLQLVSLDLIGDIEANELKSYFKIHD